MNVFDYLNSINDKKQKLEMDDSIYNQFLINKGMSYYPDTILLVNEINKESISNELHYSFLYNVIDKGRRRSEWFKEDRDDGLEQIMAYYKVSLNVAKEYLKILDAEQIAELKRKLNTE